MYFQILPIPERAVTFTYAYTTAACVLVDRGFWLHASLLQGACAVPVLLENLPLWHSEFL